MQGYGKHLYGYAMGPCEDIGSTSMNMQWAQAMLWAQWAAVVENVIGPLEPIGSTSQKR